ncbi:hypothetical protein CVS47_00839 [Microbacterium lemovicicum]|uniref:Uncharacterized protein n=1 Tax=Microbacterium lemovicicum TaxID=1072463 RepID=A0A3Q9IYY5_9MICO|nr:protealysin inhibitor emfourin [Microbacterium lemovicicum]AZS36239.1 hypothetical protein CVS47_00839 [Microbacterium lemovicicum]
MSQPTADDADAAASALVVVTVVRTGGIAGMRKTWSAEPAPDEQEHWVMLIESCPWDESVGETRGADRYVWSISARCGEQHREADLPDQAVAGPWRTLVDEVRQVAKR